VNKKTMYGCVAVFAALVVAGVFMLFDLGLGLTPLTKFFIIFFGSIIGLQCIPAVLLFVGIVKGLSAQNKITVSPAEPVTGSGVKL